jgi:hypothetical protein
MVRDALHNPGKLTEIWLQDLIKQVIERGNKLVMGAE